MNINWTAILPPYNLARLFSAYRLLEVDRDEWKQRAKEWENYALISRGMPAVSVASEPRKSHDPPPSRVSLNGRRRRQQLAWAKPMEDAADEYAAQVKNG